MTELRVIGVDAGPVPGVMVLDYSYRIPAVAVLERAEALQCTAGLLAELLTGLLRAEDPFRHTLVQVEAFVVGNRTHRSSTPGAGKATREVVEEVKALCATWETRCYERTASQVKAWATDNRLAGARLLEPTKGLRHARDAARHALFCAVRDGGAPDPLSKRHQ